MPYEPTFPQPYLKAIDVSIEVGNDFQCTINARDKITSYKITIVNVSTGEDVCYVRAEYVDGVHRKYSKVASGTESEIVSVPTQDSPLPFQGKSDSDESILTVNIPMGLGLENGQKYVWTMELGDANSSSISRDYYFTTSAIPQVSLDIPDVIDTNRINITASYSQEQNLLPAYYRFDLYSNGELIYSTDYIFSSDIAFVYDKFINGSSYDLDLLVVLDNGSEVSCSSHFYVSYSEIANIMSPRVVLNKCSTCLNVDFSHHANIDGYVVGEDQKLVFARARNSGEEYPGAPNVVVLKDGQSVYWNSRNNEPLNLEDTIQILHWHPHKSFSGKILEKIDEQNGLRRISVCFENGQFFYDIGTNDTVYYPVYDGVANAIAGCDSYSAKGEVIGYSLSDDIIEITLTLTKLDDVEIVPGMVISFDEQNGIIEGVSGDVVTLNANTFTHRPDAGSVCSVYYDNCLYTIPEDATIEDSDVLIDNDPTPDSWWYIYVYPDKVEFVEDANAIEIEEVQ